MYTNNPNQSQMYQFGNQFGGYQQPQYGAAIAQRPQPKMIQPLTPEIINKLKSTGDSLNIEVTKEELWRSACTHKENGQPTLVVEGINPDTGNEILHCTICGKSFEMIVATKEEVQKAVDLILNLLQTSKTMYLDAPAKLIEQYYQMIPLLEKFPMLYDRSQKNFNSYDNAMNIAANPGTNVIGTNGFQMMGAMLSNPYGACGMPQPMMPQQPMQPQPMMYQQPMYQQPMMPQQPMQPQPMMYQQPATANPMMYNSGVAPAPAPAPAPTQAAPAAGVVPQAPAGDATEIQQQKQFNV